MTEQELRASVAAQAEAWMGYCEGDGSFQEIIDLYNSHSPLARGYTVQYTDHWCATFVSAVAIKLGLTEIIPTECGCEKQIALFQGLNRWQELDSYLPQQGDVIFYDWDDSGSGDNTGYSDHVGIVTAVSGTSITVVEGNKNEAVGSRTISVDGTYIRGYGLPDYSSMATAETEMFVPSSWAEEAWNLAVEQGVLDGTYPQGNLTREQFAVVLQRLGLI